MICIVCRQARTQNSRTSIQFERGEFRAVVHQIPARVCPSCGESYIEEGTAAELLNRLQQLMVAGELDIVLEYR